MPHVTDDVLSYVALPAAEAAEETRCHGKKTKLGVRTLEQESNVSLLLFLWPWQSHSSASTLHFLFDNCPAPLGGWTLQHRCSRDHQRGGTREPNHMLQKVPSLMNYSRMSLTVLPCDGPVGPTTPPLYFHQHTPMTTVTIFYCNYCLYVGLCYSVVNAFRVINVFVIFSHLVPSTQ